MEVTTTKKNNVLVVALAGRMDAVTSPPLEEQLLAALDAGEKYVVFDLSKLEYVSSAGLQVLVVVSRRLRASGGELRFCALTPMVRHVFDIAGLSLRVDILPTLDEALKRFPTA